LDVRDGENSELGSGPESSYGRNILAEQRRSGRAKERLLAGASSFSRSSRKLGSWRSIKGQFRCLAPQRWVFESSGCGRSKPPKSAHVRQPHEHYTGHDHGHHHDFTGMDTAITTNPMATFLAVRPRRTRRQTNSDDRRASTSLSFAAGRAPLSLRKFQNFSRTINCRPGCFPRPKGILLVQGKW